MNTSEIKRLMDAIDKRTIPKKNIKSGLQVILNLLREGKLPKDEIYSALVYFGRYYFFDAKDILEKYTKSTDEWERYGALVSLVFDMGFNEYRKVCENYLKYDSCEENRMLGAGCLGSTLARTKDKRALRMLLTYLKTPEESWMVRSAAYGSILRVMGVPVQQTPNLDNHTLEKGIDWDYIKKVEKLIKKPRNKKQNSE